MSENYKGTIIKISNLRKHTNADRLQCTNIFGNNVVVGLSVKQDDLGIFFPVETALSAGFIYENNLSAKPDLNKDQVTKGYFGSHGRVKAQTFRGEKSMGFWLPINSLDYLNIPNEILKEGFELDEYNGLRICSKYIPNISTPSSNSKRNTAKPYKKKKESRVIPTQFRFHYDTAQLGKNMHRIQPDDIISITWKMHGTSAIASRVLVNRKFTWKDKLAKFFGVGVTNYYYDYLYASRKVVKNEFINDDKKQHYYKYDLWTEVGKENFEGKLDAGESIYYEIVGYTKDGSMIQKGFDYGCNPNNHSGKDGLSGMPTYKIYVYRITRTSPDGTVIDLSWGQVKDRCIELKVEYTPEIYYGRASEIIEDNQYLENKDLNEQQLKEWQQSLLEVLQKGCVYDQDSQFCTNKVPEEGIVVRKEGLNLEAYKLKSFRFLEFESKQLDENIVDIETSQTIEENGQE